MTTPGEEPRPINPQETVESLAERVESFLADTEDRVAQLAIDGGTQQQIAVVEAVKDTLQGIGEIVLRSVAILDETEIPLIAEKPEPEQVDEEAAYGLVRGFIDAKGFDTIFSTRELREYLRDNGIAIDAKLFGRWFKNWRVEIEEDARAAGNKVFFTRIPKELGLEPGSYALAENKADKLRKPVRPPRPSNLHLDTAAAEETTNRAAELAKSILRANPTDRATLNVARLAESLSISETDARAVYASLVGKGVYKIRRVGTLFFSIEEPKESTAAAQQQTETDSQREAFSEGDDIIARSILEALSRFKLVEYEKGLTPREIERYAILQDPALGIIGSRRINRIIRALSVTGIVAGIQSRKGSEFRVRAADKVSHHILKNPENWEQIIAAARETRQFDIPE